ncbi:SDR family NAD(P)-dependent oxidoreductase [Demequina gelatinilytica]|uniref:SDR family NAD(P)-dependent oxidoreductase n=1 Tax=Demequina gelatinilytica TaxID=1638980 RepID=UPI000782846C|nr:SDR family NAD(P)-dependent oxidoreductase [Demequina gelatinilytica]
MSRTPYDLTDRIVVVTGGAGGIGRAFSAAAVARGARIVVVDLRDDAAHAAVDALPGGAARHGAEVGDLTDREQAEAIVARIGDRHGRIDVLVNNAGMTSAARFDERSVESIERELAVNLTAPLVLTRLAVPLLRAASDPRVITTVSLGGIFPLGETPIYTASKFGLRGAMLSIALDMRDKGITMSAVLPSATDTRMLRQEALDGGNSLQFQDPPQSPQHVAATMMGLLDRPRLEAYPRPSESWLVRAAMLAPGALPRLMPLFRGRGERGQARYIRDLRARGLIRTVDGTEVAVED